MKRIAYIFPILFLVYGCAGEQNYKRETISADLSVAITPSDRTLQLSSIVKPAYDLFVPKGILLANISKVLTCDSVRVVLGRAEDGSVHLFDKDGNFKKILLKRGGGPQEAIDVNAMKMRGADIYLLVNGGTEMMRYSLSKGSFADRFRLPEALFAAADFELLGEDRYVFYKDITNKTDKEKEYKLYVYDKRTNEMGQHWIGLNKASTEYLSFGQSDCLYRFQGKLYFYEVFQKGIYELDENGIRGHIAFTDNAYTFPDSRLYDTYTFQSFIKFCQESPFIWAHRDLYEGPRYVLSNFQYKNHFYWNVIDKQKRTSVAYLSVEDEVLLEDNFSCEDYLYQTNIQDSIRYFTLSYDALSEICRRKESERTLDEFMKKHPDLQRIYQTMNEDTNDIIVSFYEKE